MLSLSPEPRLTFDEVLKSIQESDLPHSLNLNVRVTFTRTDSLIALEVFPADEDPESVDLLPVGQITKTHLDSALQRLAGLACKPSRLTVSSIYHNSSSN